MHQQRSTARVPRTAVQRGQALPLGLALLAACCASLLFMFGSSRLVDEKLNVTNAADAAAYSAGIVQARALNYEAYLNRTIVANELAVAQALTLVSWGRYFENTINRAGAITGEFFRSLTIPRSGSDLEKAAQYIAVVGGTTYVNMYTGGSGVYEATRYLEYAGAVIIDAHAIAAANLRGSQLATDLAISAGGAQLDMAREVARATDPALEVDLVPTSRAAIAAFTKTYGRFSGSDERGRLADTVMRSRDPFTAQRNWDINFRSIPGLSRNFAMNKRGGTDLVDYDEWLALDTLALNGEERKFRRFRFRWERQETPLAWGGAGMSLDGLSGAGASHGGSGATSPRTTGQAVDEALDMRTVYGYWPGLSDTQDLRDLAASADEARLGLAFFVHKPMASSRTPGRSPVVRPTGALARFDADAPEGRVAALARAEVYFDRPPRADGASELPNLYSPYWKSRLVAPRALDYAYAASRQRGLTLPAP